MSANTNTLTLADGTTLYTSCREVIGFQSPRIAPEYTRPVFTQKYFSATTSRHRNWFMLEHGGTLVCEYEFQRLRQMAGL